MIAGLLYVIGLITALVGVVMAGFAAPPLVQSFLASLNGGVDAVWAAFLLMANGFAPSGTVILWGLGLMGFARIIMLLGAINRSLRGSA